MSVHAEVHFLDPFSLLFCACSLSLRNCEILVFRSTAELCVPCLAQQWLSSASAITCLLKTDTTLSIRG